MSLGPSPTLPDFDAAQGLFADAVAIAIAEAVNNLLNQMRTAPTYRLRGNYAGAQTELLQKRDKLIKEFRAALKDKLASELERKPEGDAEDRQATDWEAVSLVDEEQIEDQLSFERIGQLINHECEAELRELSGYTSALLGQPYADPDSNPLRGVVIGFAVHLAVERTIEDDERQALVKKEIGPPLAKAMPACYRAVIESMGKRGVQAVAEHAGARAARPAAPVPPPTFEEARALWERSMEGRPLQDGETLRSWESSILGRYGHIDPIPEEFDPESSAALLDRLIRGGLPGSTGSALPSPRAQATAQADVELMALLRRLNGNSGPGRAGPAGLSGGGASGLLDGIPSGLFGVGGRAGPAGGVDIPLDGADGRFGYPAGTTPPAAGPGGARLATAGGVRALMAANLIRVHRDELVQASRGKLDHLVIEVVASLFDQILSDARVAPQMARQIARLQLPVLRVALKDPSFFSSRRHPVRRFINRVSTLAVGFSAFESGPALDFLGRVGALVSEIVEGDFDQLDLYDGKLAELEAFVREQAQAEVEATPAAATLKVKELEWKQQQRFSELLLEALESLAMPQYLKEFISKVWGRVILAVSQRDGDESATAQRFRRAAFDLVVSIQPKRSVEQRGRFLSTLPGLMATLNEGMKLIEWPEQDNTAFFGKLLAEHAGSLKTAPASELDYNLLLRGVEAAAKTPLPRPDEVAELPVVEARGPAIEPVFSAEEAKTLGLVAESAVDWQGHIAISAEDIAEGAFAESVSPAADEPASDPDDAAGGDLRDHLELGVSYQLHLKDQWERVRLSYMSPGRTMFLFKHGAGDRATISMTARMLLRLSESGRLRALERAPLVERATARARQQLTQLGAMPIGQRLAS